MLKWNVNICSLCSCLSKVSYNIKSLKAVLSPYMLRRIYFAHFQLHLRYGIIFCGGDSESKTAFKVQKRVIHIISGANKCKSCTQIFKDYRILTVTSLYILEVLYYRKRYKGSLKQNVSIQGHNTWSKLNFHSEFCNTVLFQKSEVNMGIKLYNKVPESNKNLDNFKLLKKELNSFIFSHSFHSVFEFL